MRGGGIGEFLFELRGTAEGGVLPLLRSRVAAGKQVLHELRQICGHWETRWKERGRKKGKDTGKGG